MSQFEALIHSENISDGRLRFSIGSSTDIGGGRENQDDYLVWNEDPDGKICILVVLDGHGREVGKIAAVAGKTALNEYFNTHYSQLHSDPAGFLFTAFEHAHYAVKMAFKEELEKLGLLVSEDPEGFLLKRRQAIQPWTCVHGGTSLSVVAIVNTTMFTANVGDSTGILCAQHPVLHPPLLSFLGTQRILKQRCQV